MKTRLLAIALAALPLVSCSTTGSPSGSEAGPVRYESIAAWPSSGLTRPERTVIRTGPRWAEAWQRINTYRIPAPPLPEVDFERDMVVLIAAGERPTNGYSVEVLEVRREGGFLRVHARVNAPPDDTYQAQVITYPFQAIRLPRSEGPVDIVVD